MVTSFYLVYYDAKFQEIPEGPTTQTSLFTRKFQISVIKKNSMKFSEILHE